MTQPQIISSYEPGKHSADLKKTISRLDKECAYKDLSTIIIVPAFGSIPTRVVASWLNMYTPPNQKVVRLFAQGMEVGEAYSACIENILANPELAKFKYICFLEHDNLVPPDGLVKLLMHMEERPEFGGISSLYFTKGYGGVAQIWGDSKDPILNFRPQKPDPNGGLVECNGTGMGFAVMRLSMFKNKKLRRPWFKTTSSQAEGCYTQDLFFSTDAKKNGYRFAVACDVRVGHFDLEGKFGPPDTTW